jgi:hypothetical protein
VSAGSTNIVSRSSPSQPRGTAPTVRSTPPASLRTGATGRARLWSRAPGPSARRRAHAQMTLPAAGRRPPPTHRCPYPHVPALTREHP